MKKETRTPDAQKVRPGDTSSDIKYFLLGWVLLLVVAALCVAFRL